MKGTILRGPRVYHEERGALMVQRFRIHSRGLLARAMDRLRGQDQLLIRAGDDLPIVVASYPRGRDILAA